MPLALWLAGTGLPLALLPVLHGAPAALLSALRLALGGGTLLTAGGRYRPSATLCGTLIRRAGRTGRLSTLRLLLGLWLPLAVRGFGTGTTGRLTGGSGALTTDIPGVFTILAGVPRTTLSHRRRVIGEATRTTVLAAPFFRSRDDFAGGPTGFAGAAGLAFGPPADGGGLGFSLSGRRGCGSGCPCRPDRGCSGGGGADSGKAAAGACGRLRLFLESVGLPSFAFLFGVDLLVLLSQVHIACDRDDEGQHQSRHHPGEELDDRVRRCEQLRPASTCGGTGGHGCRSVADDRGEDGEEQRNLGYRQREATRLHRGGADDRRDEERDEIRKSRCAGGNGQRETDGRRRREQQGGDPDRQPPQP